MEQKRLDKLDLVLREIELHKEEFLGKERNCFAEIENALAEVCETFEEAGEIACTIPESRDSIHTVMDILDSKKCLDAIDNVCNLIKVNGEAEFDFLEICVCCILENLECDKIADNIHDYLDKTNTLDHFIEHNKNNNNKKLH